MQGAVTFDFWDTIVLDDSDEPKRAKRGMRTKQEARRALWVDDLDVHYPDISTERANEAYDHLTSWFRHKWKVEHTTPTLEERLREGFAFLDRPPTPGLDALVAGYANMEVSLPPDLAPGIEHCLQTLSARGYRLGIISDAIVTPGVGLRRILEHYGLLHYFHHNVFSDEWGAAKPAARVFERACAGLEADPDRLVHVGDREANDIDGPVAFGCHAILYVGCVDRGTTETTRADAVCRHHHELPDLLDRILS